MMNWNKFYLVRTKAVLLRWIIRLPNLIIPFGTQHRPNATWITEAGSCFQLCSIDFWQVCSYRWLNFSIMIRELSAKESLDWGVWGGWNGGAMLFNFEVCFSPLFLFRSFFFQSQPSFRSDVWEMIDSLSVYYLYKVCVYKMRLS